MQPDPYQPPSHLKCCDCPTIIAYADVDWCNPAILCEPCANSFWNSYEIASAAYHQANPHLADVYNEEAF